MFARRALNGLALAAAAAGCGPSFEASGFGAGYAIAPNTDQIQTPPAPLPSQPPGWPHGYDGYAFAVGSRLGHSDLYGYDKVELSIAHSTADGRPVLLGDASFAPYDTRFVQLLVFGGVGWLSHGWNFELGLDPMAVALVSRRLDETDGHGHVISTSQSDMDIGVAAEANVCHGVVDLSSQWQVQLCGYTEPSWMWSDGVMGIEGGIRLRLGHAPMDQQASGLSEDTFGE